jgi:hypothetical protein
MEQMQQQQQQQQQASGGDSLNEGAQSIMKSLYCRQL